MTRDVEEVPTSVPYLRYKYANGVSKRGASPSSHTFPLPLIKGEGD